MTEGAAYRVQSFLNDTNERHVASLVNEKRKVTVIGEEHEPEEILEETTAPPPPENEPETPLLTPEQLKEFFKAAEEGSIERLEELFDTIDTADPNMTNYTESLLMTAIRAKRRKVAEYLIDQLAVDVNHSTDWIEFRLNTRVPVRERTVTCRDLAYERGFMDLVDLIDITSDEVKPSIKRYLQRRLKTRLDEIHQSFLKRMKERTRRLLIQKQEKENQVLDDEEHEQEKEEVPLVNIPEDSNLTPPLTGAAAQLPIMSNRTYKSHIEETIEKIQSNNEKSIDETGRKAFRFSNYTLHYRLIESNKPNRSINEPTPSRRTLFSFPEIPPTIPIQPLSRPTTTATLTSRSRHANSEINTQIPIRETRTSICRSARYITTPRVSSSVTLDNKSDAQSVLSASTHTSHRLLPKRQQPVRRTYAYVPQLQHAVYTAPHRSMPVTLKATAIGLPTNTRLIRD